MKWIVVFLLISSVAYAGLITSSISLDMTGEVVTGTNYVGVFDDLTVALLSDETVYEKNNDLFVSSDRYMLLVSDVTKEELDAYDRFTTDTACFGNYDFDEFKGTARNYVRLDYNNINISNNARWGSGFHKILVKNIGSSKNPKITFEVLE